MFFVWLLSSLLTFVELNCENLFDTHDDTLKQDEEFLPTSAYHWTPYRYWRKVNKIGQELLSCNEKAIPDLIALTEVENDSVLFDLTRRSLLRGAGYQYVMTDSPDERGIDVALLYSPFSFRLLRWYGIRVKMPKGHRPTRDILYAGGLIANGDTLHIFVLHAPSRLGGEAASRPARMAVAERLCTAVDSLRQLSAHAHILISGDFNDYSSDASLRRLVSAGLVELSADAKGSHGAKATYRYHGEWGSLDHIFADKATASMLTDCHIHDAPFLLEEDTKYGGMKPRRNYLGPRWLDGFSDHLPLVAVFRIKE